MLSDGVKKKTTLYYSKGFAGDKGLFYKFTPTSSGQYKFTTSASAEVSYYNANMERLGKAIARNNSVEMSMQAGQTYYISLYRIIDNTAIEKISSAIQLIGGHQHSYTERIVQPTCVEQGYTVFTCSCGSSYKDNYTNALGHNYSDGVCTRCGAKDPNYKPTTSFVDVASGSYCYDAVQWAVANGITNGTDSTHFSPNSGCTRGQVVTLLYRAQ